MVELRRLSYISINLLNGYKMSYSLNRARCRIGMVNGGLAAINRASHLCDPGSTMASGPMWAEIQSISIGLRGFSPGSPVFFPHQNRLSVTYIRLLADILDRDNLWYPSLLLNYMNKVAITVLFFFFANVLYITCAIHVLVNMHIKRFRR